MARNPDKRRCKAKNRQGEQCKNWAKPGWEVCHYHGAGGGAPKGNKNAVTTGEYETIWLDALDEEERVLFNSVRTDVIAQIDEEIRLLTIRERRMLQRIQKVMAGWEEDEIESTFERIRNKQVVPVHDEKTGQTTVQVISTYDLVETERIQKKREKLARIIAIEEALTRVQDKKTKLLELKHKIESGAGPLHPDTQKYIDALNATAEEVWDDEKE